MTTTTIASAPGKVLLAGGYLVLEQAFTGLVVGASARFYTVIKPGSLKAGTIVVHALQFEQATWEYQAHALENHVEFSSSSRENKNKFVETCLKFTLDVIFEKIGHKQVNEYLAQGLEIYILGDNDFYSQRAQLESKGLDNTAEALVSLDPFCKTNTTLADVHKTGLGSSAALTTSLVAALLLHFQVVDKQLTHDEKTFIHNVSQFVHCFAQGKVGSGFDVSSAVWGSHRYKRFNPAILTPIMAENVESKLLANSLDPNNKSWDNEVISFNLPPGFELMLADIDAGSHTPTLVGKVLQWKKSKPEEADALWNELGSYNTKVEQDFRHLTKLHEQDPTAYNTTLKACAQLTSDQWHTVPGSEAFVALVNDFNHVRSLLQKMSLLSDVPVEPEEQTRLLNSCTDITGVAMAGVPGAGGYDAIFCIVLSDEAKQQVYHVWQEWKELSVGPLLSQADSHGVASVNYEDVPGLAKALE